MAPAFNIPKLVDVCSKFKCSPEIKAMAAEKIPPSQFIQNLQEQKKSIEAVQALSRTMPKEKAVEWAAQSAEIAGEKAGISKEEIAALDAAKKWSENPCPETRQAALAAAEGLGPESPACSAANAAGFSDPAADVAEGVEVLAAAEDASAHFSASAVLQSAGKIAAAEAPETPETPETPEIPKVPEIAEMVETPEIPEVAQVAEMAETVEMVGQAVETPVEVPELAGEILPEVAEMTPEEVNKTAEVLEPFINNGLEIAKTVPGWS